MLIEQSLSQLAFAKGEQLRQQIPLFCREVLQQLGALLEHALGGHICCRLNRVNAQLQGQTQRAVVLAGKQVLEHLGKADVFVLPSFAEGVPVVLMEAMMAGVPCVSTRITGIPELIESGVSGCLVTPGSVAELAQTLKQLANDGSLRRQLAEGGRSRVCHSYNLEANLSRLSDCFSLQLQEVRS